MDVKYFKLIDGNVDPKPILAEIENVEDECALSTGRQDKVAVQSEALAIPLRGLRKSAINGRTRRDAHESRWTTGSKRFPFIRSYLEELATSLNSLPGKAKIVCLPAGKRVYPHIDRGEYYRARNRYHLVLQSTAGSWFKAEDEEIRMKESEMWWFDNDRMHEAFNDGDQSRVHIFFDLLL